MAVELKKKKQPTHLFVGQNGEEENWALEVVAEKQGYSSRILK